jgi:hypothetical protein
MKALIQLLWYALALSSIGMGVGFLLAKNR